MARDTVVPAWHARRVDDVARELRTNLETGLSPDALPAASRRDPPPPTRAAPGASSGTSSRAASSSSCSRPTGVMLALGHFGDAIAIGASVVFSVVFGFVTDFRAERALEALLRRSPPRPRASCAVASSARCPRSDLRPGDLVVPVGRPDRCRGRHGSRLRATSRSTSRRSPARASPVTKSSGVRRRGDAAARTARTWRTPARPS